MFHGAPILCALAAEFSGADLVYPFIPPCQVETAKSYSLNFIIHQFEKNFLTEKDNKKILSLSKHVDAVVIGPGLGTDSKTKDAMKSLLSQLTVPTIVDADALMYMNSFPKTTVLTPHRGEFKELTGDEPTPQNVQKWAKNLKVIIVCKGPKDIIADNDEVAINETGNPLMTVGGTGDALSGLIGGLIAQGMRPFEAGVFATKIFGKAADSLAGAQGSLRAIDIIHAIPAMLHKN